MKFNLTYHSKIERMDRIIRIVSTVGLGEKLYERYNPENRHMYILTDTGIILITDNKERVLITAYTANFTQAKWIANSKALSNSLQKKIKKNKEMGLD